MAVLERVMRSFLPSSSTPFMLHALCAPSGVANSMNPNRVEYEGSLYNRGGGAINTSIEMQRVKMWTFVMDLKGSVGYPASRIWMMVSHVEKKWPSVSLLRLLGMHPT